MTRQSEYVDESVVILALQNHMGHTGLAAKELGLSRGELLDYMVRHPSVMEAKKQIKEFVKDEAEHLLISQMREDPTLLIFFLKTQARDRGYDVSPRAIGITNTVEVKVDAKYLIAAMRQGAQEPQEELEESEESPSFFLPISAERSSDK